MDKKTQKSPARKLSTTKLFIVFSLSLILLLGSLIALIYYFENRKEELLHQSEELGHIFQIKKSTSGRFVETVTDLELLALHDDLNQWLNLDEQQHLEALSQEFLNLVEVKQVYDQARLLDSSGMEIIRAQLNNDQASLVPESELQDKGDRYYFKDTSQLDQGEVFVSPFDLNIEQGEIEKPLKPVIRFSTPVFDNKGEKSGIVIVNYLGKNLLDNINNSDLHTASENHLVNAEGYWLKSPRDEDEWGFMFEDKKNRTFEKVFPEEWKEISRNESGQFSTQNGLFTFDTIYPRKQAWRSSTKYRVVDTPSSPLIENKDRHWKIVNILPKSFLVASSREFLSRLLLLNIPIAVILIIVSWFLAQSVVQRREAERKIIDLNKIMKLINKILRHDISNDLVVIKTNLKLVLEKSPAQQEGKDALIAIERSEGLVAQMRTLEAATAIGKGLKSYNAREVVEEVIKGFPALKFKIEGQGLVKADEALKSVLENIVRNAEMHGKTDKIDISIRESRNIVEITIADYGKGIPDDIKTKLFIEGAKFGETGHTGLGLYIVWKTIERYGGKVKVVDNKPKGAIFILSLPKNKGGIERTMAKVIE